MLTYILRASTFLVYIKLYHLFSTILDTKPWERFLGTVKTKITFIMLNRFCLLSKKKNIHPIPPPSPQLPPPSPLPSHTLFLMGNMSRWRRIPNQNQIKNTCPFYNVLQVLKVFLKTVCKMKIQPPNLLFLIVFISL